MTTKPLLILVAGPHRSGTDDDPALLAANLRRPEEAAWPVFARGHVPVIGEWVALPVLRGAGASRGADQDVAIAEARGLPVHHDVEEVPFAAPAPSDPGPALAVGPV